MKKFTSFLSLTLLLMGCSTTTPLQVKVAPLGTEVEESQGQLFYTLPQTVITIDLSYRELRQVPGPYRDYAERYLGIQEVIRQARSSFQVMDVNFNSHVEMDPSLFYRLHVLDGSLTEDPLAPWREKGLVMDGSELLSKEASHSDLESGIHRDYVRFEDLGIESNFHKRTETMYKTIVTDTSFVEVPVTRTITEQKSLSMKAREAANFILELRTRRFELLTGEYEGFPAGVAMEAALAELDQLEEEYLSLFTGKTLEISQGLSWFFLPPSGAEASAFELGMFSEDLGFVPEELQEGAPLMVRLTPQEHTRDLVAFQNSRLDRDASNVIFYRIPDVGLLELLLGSEVLAEKRLSIYQSGALVSAPFRP